MNPYDHLSGPLSSGAELNYDSGSTESASLPQNEHLEGYEYEFFPPLESRYECPICLLILREPRQTKCGHRFCRDCIQRTLRNSSRCPVDNEPLTTSDIFADNFAKREILNFTIKCPYNGDGCDKIFSLGSLKAHLKECKFVLMPCPNKCGDILPMQDIEEHLGKKCRLRIVSCTCCNANIHAQLTEEHANCCPKVSVVCENCRTEITREEVQNHLQTVCEYATVYCPFRPLGCATVVKRKEEPSHIIAAAETHLRQLCVAVTHILAQDNFALQQASMQSIRLQQDSGAWLTNSNGTVRSPSLSVVDRQLTHTNHLMTSSVDDKGDVTCVADSPDSEKAKSVIQNSELDTYALEKQMDEKLQVSSTTSQLSNLQVSSTTSRLSNLQNFASVCNPANEVSGATADKSLSSLLLSSFHASSSMDPCYNKSNNKAMSDQQHEEVDTSTALKDAAAVGVHPQKPPLDTSSSHLPASIPYRTSDTGSVREHYFQGVQTYQSQATSATLTTPHTWEAAGDLHSVQVQYRLQSQSAEISQLRDLVSQLRQQNEFQARQIFMLESAVSENIAKNCNGTFFWNIKDFNMLKLRAQRGEQITLHSPPFYTSVWGYKLCLRANITKLHDTVSTGPGGQMNRQEQHFSLFVHMMQGENDAYLKWPFTGKMMLAVLDQGDDLSTRRHMQEVLDARPGLLAFQKPTISRNHRGFGFVEFMSVNAIEDGSYLFNDTLLIKAQVQPDNML